MGPFKLDKVPGVPDHPKLALGRVGVLLVNLGTPDGTDIPSIRRYLREFLSDRRVIEVNPLLWQLLLNLVILPFRSPKAAAAYREIWLSDPEESPLRRYTREQALAVSKSFDASGPVIVDWAMRYGNPSIESRIHALKEQGCDRLIVLPLYPQYSATTTAAVNDQVFRVLMKMRWQPAVRTAAAFHDHPAYIEALAKGVEAHLATLDWEPEVILASFHGLPKRYFMAGDPYHCQCLKTGRLLREKLGLDEKQFRVTFQSRFGREEWLRPYTDEKLEEIAKEEGVKRLVVVTPGFVSDCVETLEEIAMGGRETFEEAGGTHFTAIPCLNASDESVEMLTRLIGEELAGWV